MNIREITESIEMNTLSHKASFSSRTLGRNEEEKKCDIRTEYQRDRDRIIHSKSFRRLKHKTQVFLSPEGDHYRTRLTHTLEVSQIARTISRALRLNEDLTEAIALGHDLGHTPFGHCGEGVLNEVHKGGFMHNMQSLRVVEVLEERSRSRRGLNLTREVKDGILNHNGPTLPFTLEGQVVKISDRIAYINHDIDDAVRAGVLSIDDIPDEYMESIGPTHSSRINALIYDLVVNSKERDTIAFSNGMEGSFLGLRAFMFEHVYLDSHAKGEEEKAANVLRMLYAYFCDNPGRMPEGEFLAYSNGGSNESVKDYIAGMSDRYAIAKFEELFVPKFWKPYL
jgi:dGTPase